MKGPPFFKTFDIDKANKIAAERMGQIGIDIRDPSQQSERCLVVKDSV